VRGLESKVENVEAGIQNISNEVGTVVEFASSFSSCCGHSDGSFIRLMNDFFSTGVSDMRSAIRQVGTDVQAVQQAIHKIPHDISDPVFRVMDPLGKPIIIQLSRCNSFKVSPTRI
jgi:hypothetical protein